MQDEEFETLCISDNPENRAAIKTLARLYRFQRDKRAEVGNELLAQDKILQKCKIELRDAQVENHRFKEDVLRFKENENAELRREVLALRAALRREVLALRAALDKLVATGTLFREDPMSSVADHAFDDALSLALETLHNASKF